MNFKDCIRRLSFIFFLQDIMIAWNIIDLYKKNLKDLKWLYRYIRFKRNMWIFKNIFKIIRVSEKINKK